MSCTRSWLHRLGRHCFFSSCFLAQASQVWFGKNSSKIWCRAGVSSTLCWHVFRKLQLHICADTNPEITNLSLLKKWCRAKASCWCVLIAYKIKMSWPAVTHKLVKWNITQKIEFSRCQLKPVFWTYLLNSKTNKIK